LHNSLVIVNNLKNGNAPSFAKVSSVASSFAEASADKSADRQASYGGSSYVKISSFAEASADKSADRQARKAPYTTHGTPLHPKEKYVFYMIMMIG
jgi:hypothetical protein